ncbi:YhjD/YihY/BrkB family envelope integrity protein [Sneathiella aquimaris]|uniref:YhjD/YihY/BrkB family envelope integrity protein n=1 Tax=Sneathiella aquimaris TaxID=2599305 RepID=UPI00146EB85B|nr:YhjD/YihY/BrkB family envelope integrity protein [Sneathiella aquimaris]
MGKELLNLMLSIARHFSNQNCPRMATALSFQTLLAIAPVGILALSMLTYVDAYYSFQEDLIFFLFENLLPGAISQVHDFLQDLILNAQNLTYLGIAGLSITAFLLLSSIETVFAQIWQVKTTRNVFKRFLAYMLTTLLGPIALSTSLTLAKWIATLTQEASGVDFTYLVSYFRFLVPFLVIFFALFLLYRLVPASKVKWRHAAIGAAIAAALFILGKYFFRLYLVYFPSYEVIYGALAILPLFLIWLYFSWAIVLLGASVTAVLGFNYTGKMTKKGEVVDVDKLPKANS